MSPPKDKALAENVPLLAAYGASTFNRTVSKHGFAKKGRSMVTQDLVDLVGPVYEELYGEGSKSGVEGKL
jgi:ATP-dependent NAD(P)H-hydrate dehydratase